MDLFFFAFHAMMWVWLLVLWWKKEYFKQCSDPVNLFGFVYLILGAVAFLMCLISIFGCLIGKIRPDGSDTVRGLGDTEDVDYDQYY